MSFPTKIKTDRQMFGLVQADVCREWMLVAPRCFSFSGMNSVPVRIISQWPALRVRLNYKLNSSFVLLHRNILRFLPTVINWVNSDCSPLQRWGNYWRNANEAKTLSFHSCCKNKGYTDPHPHSPKLKQEAYGGEISCKLPPKSKSFIFKNQVSSFFTGLTLALALTLSGLSEVSASTAGNPCKVAIEKYGVTQGIPSKVFEAIAGVESNFRPWALNYKGRSWFGKDRRQYKRVILKLLERGDRSFDVGCMQMNYRWHHQRFQSVDQLIDPNHNVFHAGQFLLELKAEKGSWPAAVAAYHSRNPKHAKRYLRSIVGYLRQKGAK